jgi:type II secretory pathway pseudopilin PulG
VVDAPALIVALEGVHDRLELLQQQQQQQRQAEAAAVTLRLALLVLRKQRQQRQQQVNRFVTLSCKSRLQAKTFSNTFSSTHNTPSFDDRPSAEIKLLTRPSIMTVSQLSYGRCP